MCLLVHTVRVLQVLVVSLQIQNRNTTDKLDQYCSKISIIVGLAFQT